MRNSRHPYPIRKLRSARFPRQRRRSCLSCRWDDARQGGLFCKGCHGVAEVFSPRVSEVQQWKVCKEEVA